MNRLEWKEYWRQERLGRKEVWKPVVGYNGLYEVNNRGVIKSLHYKGGNCSNIIKQSKSPVGYSRLMLVSNKCRMNYNVHRLVAQAFIPNPLNLPFVLHKNETLIDGRLDNSVDNLFWGTHSDNMQDMYKKGRGNNAFQLNHPSKGKFGKDHFNSKKVLQYSLGGKFIKEWDSGLDLSRGLNISKAQVSRLCNGKRIHKEFIFKIKQI